MHKNYVTTAAAFFALLFSLASCGKTNFSSTQRTAAQAGLPGTVKPDPTLTEITVTPPLSTVSAGDNQQFIATGTYSDHSTKDLSTSVTWAVTAGDVAKLDSSTPGLVTTLKVGTTRVTATSGDVSGNATLTVTAAALVSIAVSPVSTPLGTPVQVKAVGTYSDGTTADITSQATWASGTPTVAIISNAVGSVGMLTPVTIGTTAITATLNGITGTATATILVSYPCTTAEQVLSPGQTLTLNWSGTASAAYSIVAASANPPANLGALSAASTTMPAAMSTVYTAPAGGTVSFDVSVVATPTDTTIPPETCKVRMAAPGAFGVTDDKTTIGLVGNVFQGTPGTTSTTFATLVIPTTPTATIVMSAINVPNQPFNLGFPGFPNLTAWFAIKLDGTINIPISGSYLFQLTADDGALLYIDGTQVINDDGVHAVASVTSAPITLTAGMHTIHLDYFQGPPTFLALQLLWQRPNDTTLSIIPGGSFGRPPGPTTVTTTTSGT